MAIPKFWSTNSLPVLLQSETTECGLACLAMVSSFHGLHLDIASLRHRFPASLRGSTLADLTGIASALGLASRPVRVDLSAVGRLRLPCILHWDFVHFVVLHEVGPRDVIIHDPAFGRRRLRLEEVSRHFTGVALEVTPANDFRPSDQRRATPVGAVMGRVVGLKRGVLKLLVLGLLLQLCSLLAPFYVQWVVDEAIVSADHDLVPTLGIGFFMLMVLQTVLSGVRTWYVAVLSLDVNRQWLSNAFEHLFRLPLSFFERRHLSDIVNRFESIHTIQRAVTTQFSEALIDGVLVALTFLVMLTYSPVLAGVAGAAAACYAAVKLMSLRPLREATAEQVLHAARQQGQFIESVRGVKSIRLFNRTNERRMQWSHAMTDVLSANAQLARIGVVTHGASTLLFGAERIAIVWLAANSVLAGQFTVGMLFAFLGYKEQFSQRMASLIDNLVEWRTLRVHASRIAEVVLEAPEPRSFRDHSALPDAIGIDVEDLSFRYSPADPDILRGLSFHVPAGQCVAISGPSGCGKSTLVKLLLGLERPTGGQVLLARRPIEKIGLELVRSRIGTVLQDDTLFSGTIAENIAFFDSQPDTAFLRECARLACIHEEVMAMPMRYETLVGDRGTGLSGGQQQRILLARALYKRPSILILDEATSHLDVWNEASVNAAIRDLAITRIVIAHRMETIASCDRVLTLREGRIASDFYQAAGHVA